MCNFDKDCRPRILAAFIAGFLGAVLILMTGCTTLDPLGSPAQNPETGERDYITRGGVICRELMGNVQGAGFGDAYGGGFRCLDVGENPPEGCIQYTDGRFSYTSPGCE